MTIAIAIIIGIFAVALFVRNVQRASNRAGARMADHRRCAYCHSTLKRASATTGFATTCRKCGREQPWATGAHVGD